MARTNVTFLCRDIKVSPSIGVPVYVKDEALKKNGFPVEHRGGTIIEDLSFEDVLGRAYYVFKVRHANGEHVWSTNELVEIGGLNIG